MRRGLTREDAERGVQPPTLTPEEWTRMWLGSVRAEAEARERWQRTYAMWETTRGSAPRPLSVSADAYADAWARTFGAWNLTPTGSPVDCDTVRHSPSTPGGDLRLSRVHDTPDPSPPCGLK